MTNRPISTSFSSRVIKLGSTLSRKYGCRCLSCSKALAAGIPTAILSHVFCSRACERSYVCKNLKSLRASDCSQILARIDALLKSVEDKMF